MPRTLISLLPLLLFFQLKAQADPDSLLVRSINTPVLDIFIDKIGHLYVLTPKNSLVKYSPSGDSLFRFNNNNLGRISNVDATNPLGVLLYMDNTQKVVLLDRTLNMQEALDFSQSESMPTVGCIALSNQNTIWIYDQNDMKLKLYDKSGKVIRESNSLSFFTDVQVNPCMMLERNNLLYVACPEHGVMIFDNFGNYVKTLYLEGIASFQVVADRLIYWKEGQLKAFHLVNFKHETISLPDTGIKPKKVLYEAGQLYLQHEDGVLIFRIE